MQQLRKTVSKNENRSSKPKAAAGLLLSEEAGYLEAEDQEETYKIKQHAIVQKVDVASRAKSFSLQLNHGPYVLDYDKNGRSLLLGGKKGHLAVLEWHTKNIKTEFHTQEEIRDITWLHNETLFAVAQKKYLHIYDNNGLEIHRLKNHLSINKLEFLPYHFLLASINKNGVLRYLDTSTGKLITSFRTKLGNCNCMCQNPNIGVINLGHQNGTVTLWKPSISEPIVEMLCHKGPICAIAVDNSGKFIATSGLDGLMKIWDVRAYKALQTYQSPRPVSAIAISHRGLLAAGFGPNVQIRNNAFAGKQQALFMSETLPSTEIENLKFCPYEDILGIGHARGINSFIIPGAGEPNFDSLAASPFQTKKQRQETEVKSLLEKIQPELITLNPKSLLIVRKNISADKRVKEKVNLKSKLKKRNLRMKYFLKKGRTLEI